MTDNHVGLPKIREFMKEMENANPNAYPMNPLVAYEALKELIVWTKELQEELDESFGNR